MFKKGTQVKVITGKDKGKTGKIIKMVPKEMKVVVSEINKVKKNQKPDNNQPGGIIGGCWGGTRILAEKDCVQHVH